MSSTKSALLRMALTLTAVGTLGCPTLQAQEGSQPNQTPRSVPGKITALSDHGNAPSLAFAPNPFAASLKGNHRAFAAAVPKDLASELSNANLPAPAKTYSFPALANARLLSPATFPAKGFQDLGAPGLNTSKLRRRKLPRLAGSQ